MSGHFVKSGPPMVAYCAGEAVHHASRWAWNYSEALMAYSEDRFDDMCIWLGLCAEEARLAYEYAKLSEGSE